MKTAPCVIHYPENDTDQQTIVRRAMKDNGTFGKFDWDKVANEWDDMPLADWGVPVWENEAQKQMHEGGLSTQGREGAEGYDEFVDKFKQKLTTDDCYTPPEVYDAVKTFVGTITDLKGKKIERPFFPGGDYEKYEYTERSIVIDNPPFSILSKIIRFYCGRNIPFFLFGPALTLFTATDCDVTYIISDSDIVYENGASVRTGFITNLVPDLRIWCCPELSRMLDEVQGVEDKTRQGFVYPDNIVTAATLQKVVKRGAELKIRKVSCEAIKKSDSASAQGRQLYGGGFLLSDKAAEDRVAAEQAAEEQAAADFENARKEANERRANQRANATRLNLSERERAIIERLNEQEKKTAPGD